MRRYGIVLASVAFYEQDGDSAEETDRGLNLWEIQQP